MAAIRISTELKKILSKRIRGNETYEDVIWNLLETRAELSEKTKRDIAKSERDYREGKFKTLEQVRKDFGI